MGREGRVEAITAAGFAVQQAGLDCDQGRGRRGLEALAQAKRGGVKPGSAEANELAARHRSSIERFYDCGSEIHRSLVEMYLADERFTRYYDVEPGLAQCVHDIVVASYT